MLIPLSVKIYGILDVKYRLDIANIAKRTLKLKPYVVLILSWAVFRQWHVFFNNSDKTKATFMKKVVA
jgi:hypothetical protein